MGMTDFFLAGYSVLAIPLLMSSIYDAWHLSRFELSHPAPIRDALLHPLVGIDWFCLLISEMCAEPTFIVRDENGDMTHPYILKIDWLTDWLQVITIGMVKLPFATCNWLIWGNGPWAHFGREGRLFTASLCPTGRTWDDQLHSLIDRSTN